jgi:hypothetical protein
VQNFKFFRISRQVPTSGKIAYLLQFIYLFIYFVGQGLNSGFCACKAGALPLKQYLQPNIEFIFNCHIFPFPVFPSLILLIMAIGPQFVYAHL